MKIVCIDDEGAFPQLLKDELYIVLRMEDFHFEIKEYHTGKIINGMWHISRFCSVK